MGCVTSSMSSDSCCISFSEDCPIKLSKNIYCRICKLSADALKIFPWQPNSQSKSSEQFVLLLNTANQFQSSSTLPLIRCNHLIGCDATTLMTHKDQINKTGSQNTTNLDQFLIKDHQSNRISSLNHKNESVSHTKEKILKCL